MKLIKEEAKNEKNKRLYNEKQTNYKKTFLVERINI